METLLPLYRTSIDWGRFGLDHPAPDVWAETVFKFSADEVRDLQNRRFLAVMKRGWSNAFYNEHWGAAGIEPGDIRSIADIAKLPTFTSEDIKNDQGQTPPFGAIAGIDFRDELRRQPLKVHTSGGTTGKARPALMGVEDYELLGLIIARGLYVQGARPGDVLQIPSTCALTQFGWVYYKACHDYLGILPVTTGSGVVTPARKQLEFAFDFGTNIIASFPEYLTSLAKSCRDELGRDVRELGLKFLPTYLGPDTEGRLREDLQQLYGCKVFDNYGFNEASHVAFEGPDQDGLYLFEDTSFTEIADTDTMTPVEDGVAGNLIVTALFRNIPPIIRFNTRDVSRIRATGRSALGSQFRRLDHFLGRSDDMVKIRGTNVYPMACLNAVKADPRTTGEWVCVAERHVRDGEIRDELTVRVELKGGTTDVQGLRESLETRLKADLGLRVAVELATEGDLAEVANLGREGKARRLIDRRFAK